jgi:hypothetical protein
LAKVTVKRAMSVAEDNEKMFLQPRSSTYIMQCNEYELFMLNNKKYLPKWETLRVEMRKWQRVSGERKKGCKHDDDPRIRFH